MHLPANPQGRRLSPPALHPQPVPPSTRPPAPYFLPARQFDKPILPRSQSNYIAQVWNVFKSQESATTQRLVLHYKTCPCKEYQMGHLCKQETTKDGCFNFHEAYDRRRPPFTEGKLAYSHQICPTVSQGQECRFGDKCGYAHNTLESLFHPAKFRTVYCQNGCTPGYVCPHAHSQEEFRTRFTLLIYQLSSPLQAPVPQSAFEIPSDSLLSTSYLPSPLGLSPIRSYPTRETAMTSKSRQNAGLDLDLNSFKSSPCPFSHLHNQKRCIYFHSIHDRRRVPIMYSSERCPNQKLLGQCELNDACRLCHNVAEQMYHPEKYKKRMCQGYPKKLAECEYGEYCSFAHAEQELKLELLHEYAKDGEFYMSIFKTEWCPFNHEHNKSICVYAHNWQDFRRNPASYSYSSDLCPNWKPDLFITSYVEGCRNGFECMFSHGWKEHLFHPHSYKTYVCPDMTKCHQGPECPYYHTTTDRRYPCARDGFYSSSGLLSPFEQVPTSGKRRSDQGPTLNRSAVAFTTRGQPWSTPGNDMGSSRGSAGTQEPIHKQTVVSRYEDCKLNEAAPLSEFAALKNAPDEEDIEPGVGHTPSQTHCSNEDLPCMDTLSHTTAEDKKSPESTSLKAKDEDGGSRSCPISPVHLGKKYGQCEALRVLHLEGAEGSDEADVRRLSHALQSIGLGHLQKQFTDAQYSLYDLMIDTEQKCRSVGIQDEADIRKIESKVQTLLEHPLAESPGTCLDLR